MNVVLGKLPRQLGHLNHVMLLMRQLHMLVLVLVLGVVEIAQVWIALHILVDVPVGQNVGRSCHRGIHERILESVLIVACFLWCLEGTLLRRGQRVVLEVLSVVPQTRWHRQIIILSWIILLFFLFQGLL